MSSYDPNQFRFQNDPDELEEYRRPAPQVVTWFKVYAVFLALLYVLTLVMGVGFMMAPPTKEMPAEFLTLMGVMLILMSIGLIVVSLLPLFPRPQPWVWTYNLVLICLGMTGCTFVVCIPLIIYWLKPETKQYYGKE